MRNLILLLSLMLAGSAAAQLGDKPGEPQSAPIPNEKIPPAPPLTPEQALKSFTIPADFSINLVAHEPLIEAPVAASFGPDGRLWVVEMRAFMPNLDGIGETEPAGRISVLEDTNNDGRMDKSTVFLDRLIMPRSLMLVRDGLLVAEPPNLWFCRDTNGDGRADERSLVANDYAIEADPNLGVKSNPEHSANNPLWAIDNWIYSANYTTRFRNTAGLWQRDSTPFRGQWGLSLDNFGRLFFNSNSDQLRADLLPAHYLARNPSYPAAGANVRLAEDQSVWPGRVNPGVNRAYLSGTLRPDGTLATFTAACGPLVYRGHQFPPEFNGNVFLCEPAANLIRRNLLIETNGLLQAVNPYAKSEFLTSTDERFRPVNLFNGPDGTLYIVDMYRGAIEHRNYLTSYLRQQYHHRGLDKPLNLGRIYRVAHKSIATTSAPNLPPSHQPRLATAPSLELVQTLTHPNGWWRDTAQRLLVERADLSVVPDLKKLASSPAHPLAQLHALWTLEGLARLDKETLLAALNSPHPKIAAAAIRLSEPFLNTHAPTELVSRIITLSHDPRIDVLLQVALTLGQFKPPFPSSSASHPHAALADLVHSHQDHSLLRDAALSSLSGHELDFLRFTFTQKAWSQPSPGSIAFISALAQSLFAKGQEPPIVQLLDLAALQTNSLHWRQIALLDGILKTAPASVKIPHKPVQLASAPPALQLLAQSSAPETQDRLAHLQSLLSWPGKPVPGRPPASPLTAEQQARFETGKELYLTICGACHQPHGNGQEGLAPPLTDSEWVLGPESRLIRIALHGARGPMTVKGKISELEMPSLSILDDQQLSAILTYIRREWGHTAPPVEPESVQKIRAETSDRVEPWTEPELLKLD